MREITLALKGQPMAKQSVRGSKKGYYQPAKYKARTNSYILQIKSQLPNNFVMFTKIVHVEFLQIMFEPLSQHKKTKYIMELFKGGGTIDKTTNPDVMDNLNKLLFDSMSGIVYKDDGLICRANNISKVYGLQGQIVIKLKGL
jgi:Holliday junction resolvase RusA-like endonuclease